MGWTIANGPERGPQAERQVRCEQFERFLPAHSPAAMLASAAVVAVSVAFYSYATVGHEPRDVAQYPIEAIFLSSDGLQAGADVRLAGVKIGTVSSIELDPSTFVAQVVFRISTRYRLPSDTSLSIGSSGFTAANALLVTPGHSSRMLVAGSVIRATHAMQSLEQTVSQYIFGGGGLDDPDNP